MRRVLLSALGVGLGHAVRIQSIANQLKGKAEFEILASGVAYDYLKNNGFSPIKIGSIDYAEDKGFVFNILSTIVRNVDYPLQMTRNYFKISSVIERFKPDCLLCDSEPTSFLTALHKRLRVNTITNLPLTVDESKRVNIVGEMRKQLAVVERTVDLVLRNSEITFVPTFVKPRYYLRSVRYVGSILRKERKAIDAKGYFLVSLGGSGFGSEVLKALMRVLTKFEDKKFIVATNYKYLSRMKHKNMTVMPFVSESYLRNAMGVISLGGYVTLCECVSYKKPIFMIPIKDHVEQYMNAHMMKRYGFGDYVHFKKGIDESLLEEKLRAFFENYKDYKEKLEKYPADSDGAKEIAEAVI